MISWWSRKLPLWHDVMFKNRSGTQCILNFTWTSPRRGDRQVSSVQTADCWTENSEIRSASSLRLPWHRDPRPHPCTWTQISPPQLRLLHRLRFLVCSSTAACSPKRDFLYPILRMNLRMAGNGWRSGCYDAARACLQDPVEKKISSAHVLFRLEQVQSNLRGTVSRSCFAKLWPCVWSDFSSVWKRWRIFKTLFFAGADDDTRRWRGLKSVYATPHFSVACRQCVVLLAEKPNMRFDVTHAWGKFLKLSFPFYTKAGR